MWCRPGASLGRQMHTRLLHFVSACCVSLSIPFIVLARSHFYGLLTVCVRGDCIESYLFFWRASCTYTHSCKTAAHKNHKYRAILWPRNCARCIMFCASRDVSLFNSRQKKTTDHAQFMRACALVRLCVWLCWTELWVNE